jgi:hypothetical protein
VSIHPKHPEGSIASLLMIVSAMLLLAIAPGNAAAKSAPKRALVVGKAGGPVYRALRRRYKVTPGTGSEDPTKFDLVIFDGNHHSGQDLHDSPATSNFLANGKMLIILNNTEDHRGHLGGMLWAHAQGTSPGVAYVIQKTTDGAQVVTQIDFPFPYLDNQLSAKANQWLDLIQSGNQGSSILPASAAAGQTVVAFDDLVPVTMTIPARVDSLGAPGGIALSPSHPNASTTSSVTFETRMYAMLEGDSADTFQQKIFARQFLLSSPDFVLDDNEATEIYKQYHTHLQPPINSALGFNDQFTLSVQVPSDVQSLLGVVENLPEANNNVTQLTTSKSQTESVGVSATAGFAGKSILGSIGVSWGESWTWGEAQTVDISDWGAKSQVIENTTSYTFSATGGTPNTTKTVGDWIYPGFCAWVSNPGGLSQTAFNGLQTSAMTSQSETEWSTNSGSQNLLPAQPITITSTAVVLTGEIFNYPYAGYCDVGGITGANVVSANLPINISLDFSWPALQPPAPAPWSIHFLQPVSNGNGQWSAPGTVTLNAPSSTDTTIPISWVIQPQTAMLTVGNVCPGNATTFNPGTSVLSGAQTSVTIPAGQTQAQLSPVFEPIGDPYNVQVVAWQGAGNLQAADCVTVPAQAP